MYEVREFDTFRELIDMQAVISKDRIAFVYETEQGYVEKTYSEFKKDIESIISFFHFKAGNKVAIIGKNSYDYIAALFSILYVGGTVIPISPDHPRERLLRFSEDCDFVFFDMESVGSKRADEWLPVSQISKAIEAECPMEKLPEQVRNDDLAFIIYTSGTCGINKGVMLTQKNVCSNFVAACHQLDLKKRAMLLLPLYHMYGMLSLGVVLASGEATFILSNREKLMDSMKYFQPRQIIVVPLYVDTFVKILSAAMRRYVKLKGTEELSDEDKKAIRSCLSANLETVISGGAPLNWAHEKIFETLGIELLNGYGITECSPLIAVNTPEEKKKNSVGRVVEKCEVSIRNPIDGIGEICVKGLNVMRGYYKDPEADKLVFEDGWFMTGDLGYLDDDGFLYISGRKKNLIICGNGENVCPEELESFLYEIPGVEEAVAASGEGDYIKAEIYLGSIDDSKRKDVQNEIQKYIDQLNLKMPSHKKISQISFRNDPFPRGATGKILRH